MRIDLEGRTALITGGSAGLGRAMAVRFADAGARVAILARRPEPLDDARREIGERCLAVPCDVRDPAALAAAHAQVVATLGPVDILVNNAGTSATGPFLDLDDGAWQADLDLKLFAAIRLTRLTLPGMRERAWGRILNVLNTAAKAPPAASYPTSVSRAAGLAFTKALAGEVARDGVLVNALCTGRLVSEQWERRHPVASGEAESLADYFARVGSEVPIGRMGEADEFARIACFLASDAASYITGAAINVDGGLSPVP